LLIGLNGVHLTLIFTLSNDFIAFQIKKNFIFCEWALKISLIAAKSPSSAVKLSCSGCRDVRLHCTLVFHLANILLACSCDSASIRQFLSSDRY